MTVILIDVDLVEAFSAGTRCYMLGLPRLTFARTGAEREAFVMGWDAGCCTIPPDLEAVDEIVRQLGF